MIEHHERHEELLARLSPDRVMRTMGAALLDGAQDIAEDAAQSIRDGAISGGRPYSIATRRAAQQRHRRARRANPRR